MTQPTPRGAPMDAEAVAFRAEAVELRQDMALLRAEIALVSRELGAFYTDLASRRRALGPRPDSEGEPDGPTA